MKIQKRQEIEFFGTKTGNANSIALGYATETKNFGEVAVGVMNKSTAAKDPNSPKGVCIDSDATLFSVGCGGSGERKNALEVKGDGSVLISGENGDINVADKIKQALDTNASIELVKSADSDLQYTLMVNNESRGSINIPKDQFLKNVTYDTEAKQLVFTFVTLDEEEHVERISINDLKDVYTAGDGINIDNNVISADFSSVMTAISDEKTQRETTDNEIKSTLDTKADKTSLEKQVEYLKGHSFYLGDEGQVASPFKAQIFGFDEKIQEVKNDEKYAYVDISGSLGEGRDEAKEQYIYDKSLDKSIYITEIGDDDEDVVGDLFRTAEPLDLSHTFYLDNEKTGDTENLEILTIAESDVFENLPYVETGGVFEDDETPQYIYDATDRKWIEVVEMLYIRSYSPFNTEEPLDLTHEFGYCYYPIILGNYASTGGNNAIALGCGATAVGTNSIALGREANASEFRSIAIGENAKAKESNSVALGCGASTSKKYSIALGYTAKATDESSIALGFAANATSPAAIALGLDSTSSSNGSIALGSHAKAYKLNSIALGSSASANGLRSIALGCDTVASADDTIVIGKNNYSSNSACYSLSSGGKPLMEIERNNKGLYLQNLGGYDGTNLVVKNGDTETLNPDIRSVQQIINEKADTTAIPAKLSDLENDKVNITTSKDDTSYSFKIDYKDGDVLRSTLGYKPYGNNNTNIAEFGLYSYDTTGNRLSQIRMRPENNKDDGQYLIQVQDVKEDKLNKASSITTTGFDNQNYENGTAVLLESNHLEFYVISNGFQKQLTVNKDGITKTDGKATEVFAADGTLFDLTTKADTTAIPTKVSQLTNDANFITSYTETDPVWTSEKGNYYTKSEIDGKGYLTAHQSLADYAKKTEIPNVSTKADLVDGKLKADQLPKLDNIAAATTTEDMITKFNALLTDLKAKGYMIADITA